MAYTGVKLADVNKAIAAVKAAQKTYDDAASGISTSKAKVEKAKKDRDEALAKVESLKKSLEGSIKEDTRYQSASSKLQSSKEALEKAQKFLDSKDYLKNNEAYNKAVTAFNDADQKLKEAYRLKDSGDYLKNNSTYQTALSNFRSRENDLLKADEYRKNSNDRYNSDSDIKNYRSKYEEAQRAVDRAWENVRSASKSEEASAEQKWVEARKNVDTIGSKLQQAIENNDSKADTAVNNAIKARDFADQAMRNAEQEASKGINTFVSNAQNTRKEADANRSKIEDVAYKAAQKSVDDARAAFNTADTTFGKVDDLVRREYDTKYMVPAQNTYNKAIETFSAANTDYNKLNDSLEGLKRAVPERIQDVNDYINTFRSSLGDVKTKADAIAAQKLLDGINNSIKDSGNKQLKEITGITIADIDVANELGLSNVLKGFKGREYELTNPVAIAELRKFQKLYTDYAPLNSKEAEHFIRLDEALNSAYDYAYKKGRWDPNRTKEVKQYKLVDNKVVEAGTKTVPANSIVYDARDFIDEQQQREYDAKFGKGAYVDMLYQLNVTRILNEFSDDMEYPERVRTTAQRKKYEAELKQFEKETAYDLGVGELEWAQEILSGKQDDLFTDPYTKQEQYAEAAQLIMDYQKLGDEFFTPENRLPQNTIKDWVAKVNPEALDKPEVKPIEGLGSKTFADVDPDTGLPALNQKALDAVLDRYKSNSIDEQQYRDNWNKFGWNVKSDASFVKRGPAIVGIDVGPISQGITSTYGYKVAGTNQGASEEVWKKAAEQLGIDFSQYVTQKQEYRGPTGGGTVPVNVIDEKALYDEIYNRTKDFYLVGNSLDGTDKHAAILFKADGSGYLTPVADQQGTPTVTYYNATRNIKGGNWYDDLLPVAAIGAAILAPQAIGAISGALGGGTAATMTAGALYNAGTTALLGGDWQKAGLMGAGGALASVKATEIANAAVGGAENVAKIAELANVTIPQAEKAIASGFVTGITSAAVDRDNILVNSAAATAGQLGSAKAKNFVQEAMLGSPAMNTAVNVTSNLADVTAQTLVRIGGGQDVDLATSLQNSMPSIIGEAALTAGQTFKTPIVEKSYDPETFDINAEINKAFIGPSVKLELAQALPVTAEQIQTLSRMGEQNLAQRFSSLAANDPKFVRELANPENIQALRNAGMSTLAEALSKFSVAVTGLLTPGNIGQVTNEDLIMAEKLKQYIEPITLPKVEVIGDTSDLKFPGLESPASEVEDALKTPWRPMPDTDPNMDPTKVPKPPLPIAVPTPSSQPKPSPSPQPKPSLSPYPTPTPSPQQKPSSFPQPSTDSTITGQPKSYTTYPTTTKTPTSITLDKTLPAVDVIGRLEDEFDIDKIKASQQFPLTEQEAIAKEEEKKQSALQQYMQQIRAQQQKTQELIDPKSIYYLTPEEQAARGYINPAELYESITPFKRGGLASMKRKAKWQ